MRLAELLRLTAIGIALLCWLDPPLVVAPQPPVAVDVALLPSPHDGLPAETDAGTTVGERVREAGAEIVAGLGAAGDVRVSEPLAPGQLPCDAQRPCVMVGGAGASVRVPADRRGPTFLVRVSESPAANVSVTGLTVAPAHAAATAGAVVRLRGRGVAGRDTRVRLLDGSAVVGETVHRWTGEDEAEVAMPWWPLAAGMRTLVARASLETDGEVSGLDNEARAAVDVQDDRWPVLVLERRPSWSATFVRRALERDRRFAVDARTDVAPGVAARSAPAGELLDEARLDRARVLLVGAPESLDAADVTRLDAFVRRRGGALVLVPDRALSGPVTRLLPHAWREHLEPGAVDAGPLRGREWLLAAGTQPFDDVIAAHENGPAVVASAVGPGRIVVAGALDAWRHRGDGSAFDRFWTSLTARLAQSAGDVLDVTVERSVAAPGDDLRITATGRTVRPLSSRRVSARMACDGAQSRVLRLWPDHSPATFVGRARIPASATRCVVTAEMAGVGEGRADIVVTPAAIGTGAADVARMEEVVTATGGLVVSDRDLAPLTDALRALASEIRTPETRYPMRSLWWFPVMVMCLGGEWWLRRRMGLR